MHCLQHGEVRLQVVVLHDVGGLAPETLQITLLFVDKDLTGKVAFPEMIDIISAIVDNEIITTKGNIYPV